jgi:hypothetical protein
VGDGIFKKKMFVALNLFRDQTVIKKRQVEGEVGIW